MRIIEHNLKAINNEIEVIPIGDTHIGANFNETLLRETINYILDKPNRYCILNGDILDAGIVNSRANVYENDMTPSAALSYAHILFKPLADANKILCSCGGNHDADRMARETDITASMELAVRLGITDYYSKDSCVLFIRASGGIRGNSNKNAFYTIFVSHGRNGGGGKLAGSKANALQEMANLIPNADIYIHSHSHFPMTFKDSYYNINEQKKLINQQERMFVNTNAFQNYLDSYAEAKLLRASSMAIPKIKLKTVRYSSKGKNKYDYTKKIITCEV